MPRSFGIVFDFLQGFSAVLLRHIQIQKDQTRARADSGSRELASVIEIIHEYLHRPRRIEGHSLGDFREGRL